MENNQNNYNPIDYRINKDLNSMKPKKKSNINRIFYSLFGLIIILGLIIIFIQNNNNNKFKLEVNTLIIADTMQNKTIDSLYLTTDSLNLTIDSLNLTVESLNNHIKLLQQILDSENK